MASVDGCNHHGDLCTRNGTRKKKASGKQKLSEFETEYQRAVWFVNRRDRTEKIDNQVHSGKFESCKKQMKLSVDNRNKAEELFESGLITAAFETIKQSLKYSSKKDGLEGTTNNCNTMAAAHAARARMFMLNKNYELCLSDAELALSCGYPGNLQHSLYLTMGQAKLAQKESNAAISYFEKALSLFQLNGEVEESVKTEFSNGLTKRIEEMKEKITVTPYTVGIQTDEANGNGLLTKCVCGVTSCGRRGCSFKDVAKCGLIPHVGNGLFSQRTVKRGEVVFVDKAWATVLGQKYMDVRCQYCLCYLELFCVPCDFCSQVLFCSKTCKGTGWKQFHKFECGIIDYLCQLGPDYRIAYRLFSMTPWESVKDVFVADVQKRVKLAEDRDTQNKPVSTEQDLTAPLYKGYLGVYYMYRPSHPPKLDESELGTLYERCYTMLSFYEKKQDPVNYLLWFKIQHAEGSAVSGDIFPECTCYSEGDASFMARAVRLSILKRHLDQVRNHCAVAAPARDANRKFVKDVGSDLSMSDLRVFPIGALMNHACKPNVKEVFIRFDKVAYQALSKIDPGDELTKDYNRFSCINGPELQFECLCARCYAASATEITIINEEWIDLQVLFCEFCLKDISATKTNDVFMCKKCFKKADAQDVLTVRGALGEFSIGCDLMTAGNLKEAMVHYRRCCDIRATVATQEKSSLMFMSWYCVARSLENMDKSSDALDYVQKLLNVIREYPAFQKYINFPSLHYFRLKWLMNAFESSLSARNFRYSKKLIGDLGYSMKILTSEEFKTKTVAQTSFINSVAVTMSLLLSKNNIG